MAGIAYDVAVDGPITDKRQCLEQLNATNGTFYAVPSARAGSSRLACLIKASPLTLSSYDRRAGTAVVARARSSPFFKAFQLPPLAGVVLRRHRITVDSVLNEKPDQLALTRRAVRL